MNKDHLIKWLLSGDVSIQYQVHRDLLNSDKKQLRDRISKEGWGAKFLKKRRKDGKWPLQARHSGQTHFEMEETGKHSRWKTLRALRVLRHFNIN